MLSDRAFTLLLASIIALTPMAIDLYLPAIPLIANDFDVAENRIAIGVSIYMMGLVIGQLIAGPASDRYGRKLVMQSGTVVFAIASIALALSTNWQQFWLFRTLQALGGGVAVVGVLASVRDRSDGTEAAKLIAQIAFIMTIAPAIAPAIGSLLLLLGSWRCMFVFLAIYASVLLVVIHKHLNVTQSRFAVENETWYQSYAKVFGNISGSGYFLVQGLAFGAMLTFVINSSYLYQTLYGLNSFQFSALFALNIVGMALMNRLNVRLLKFFDTQRLAVCGVLFQNFFAASLLLSIIFELPLPFVCISIVGIVSAQGLLMPNVTANAMQPFPERAGVASAALGMTRYLVGGSISGFSTQFQGAESFIPTAALMATVSGLALLTLLLTQRLQKRR